MAWETTIEIARKVGRIRSDTPRRGFPSETYGCKVRAFFRTDLPLLLSIPVRAENGARVIVSIRYHFPNSLCLHCVEFRYETKHRNALLPSIKLLSLPPALGIRVADNEDGVMGR